MKTTTSLKTNWIACLLLATTPAVGIVGCAGDRYNRSTGEYIDDHSLQMRVDHALNDNPDFKFKDVKIATFKGTVELNGFVDESEQKSKAEDIAKQVPGVRQVDNNIGVAKDGPRSAGQATDDKAEASRVSDGLHNNPEYKFDGVDVAVYKGIVQLSGFVNTADQKSKAADQAKQISGASDVENQIVAKDTMKQ